MENLKVAYLQADISWEDIDENLRRFTKRIQIVEEKVDLIVLPETFNTGFSPNIHQLLEPMNGKTMQWMSETAKHKNAVIAGSLLISEDGNPTNRFIWMNPDGSYEYYDKKHLFLLSKEAQILKKGNELKTFHLKGWKIRPFICYDVRFPCWNRNRYENGEYAYDFAIFVASWPVQRATAWRTLVPARAVENQAYVLGLNRVGVDGVGDMHIGDSQVIDFLGNVISSVPQGIDSIGIVELNYENLKNFRNNFKVAADWDLLL